MKAILVHQLELYHRAMQTLLEGLTEYESHDHNLLMRDGLIQRYEYCVELTRKTLKRILDEVLIDTSASPVPIIKSAQSASIIHRADILIDMVRLRNTFSHIYDEHDIQESFALVLGYKDEFEKLYQEMRIFIETL